MSPRARQGAQAYPRRSRTIGVDPSLPRDEYLTLLAKGMSENALLGKIRDAVKDVPRVLIYHTHDSRRSEAGFPDLVLVLDGRRVVYVELKTQTGRLSAAQVVWRDTLLAAGQDWRLWRPREWVDGTITAVLTEHVRAA